MGSYTGSDKRLKFLFQVAFGLLKSIAPKYDNTQTYAVGAYVLYEDTLYKCTTAVTIPEDFDSTKWTQVKLVDEIGSGGGTTVIANPAGAATDTLNKLQVGSTIYGVSGGGGGGSFTQTTLWSGSLSTQGNTAPLSESYQNFHDIIIKWSAYSDGSAYQKTVLIPVHDIVLGALYQFGDSMFRNGSQYCQLAFGFNDYTTLTLSQITKVASGVGSGVIIQEIIGRKY